MSDNTQQQTPTNTIEIRNSDYQSAQPVEGIKETTSSVELDGTTIRITVESKSNQAKFSYDADVEGKRALREEIARMLNL